MIRSIKVLGSALILLLFISCDQSGQEATTTAESDELTKASAEQIEQLVEQFILVEDGGTIDIPAGYYEMESQLIIDGGKRIHIKGAGMDQTVLSFRDLMSGGEGIKIQGDSIVLEDLTVQDAPGDGIKTQHCNMITFRNLRTTWTHGDFSLNGTYGIYPVQCENVLVEGCEVSRSRDAGIYVGQSKHIVVRNNMVFENVAGIEIENSDDAEVYNNHCENNTGGILVFNLPGLPKPDGYRTKVYNNDLIENNHENFAVAINETNNGNAVTQIPPGSGIILLGAKDVEVYDNRIINHKTLGIAIASYHITQFPIEEIEGWSPFVHDIYVHDNHYERKFGIPDMTKDMGKLIAAKRQKAQDVIYDGIIDDARGSDVTKNPMNICIQETIEDLRFSRFELPADGDLTKIKVYDNIQDYNCQHDIEVDIDLLSAL